MYWESVKKRIKKQIYKNKTSKNNKLKRRNQILKIKVQQKEKSIKLKKAKKKKKETKITSQEKKMMKTMQ